MTDACLCPDNILDVENESIFLFLRTSPYALLMMNPSAKELLSNWHEIHFVSTQLGTPVTKHLFLSSVFLLIWSVDFATRRTWTVNILPQKGSGWMHGMCGISSLGIRPVLENEADNPLFWGRQ